MTRHPFKKKSKAPIATQCASSQKVSLAPGANPETQVRESTSVSRHPTPSQNNDLQEGWSSNGVTVALVPLSRAKANAYVKEHHSHHDPIKLDICRVGVAVDGELVGCAIAECPTAPEFQKTATIVEVTRLCTDSEAHALEGLPIEALRQAGSMLLGAISRALLGLGYRRLVSYTRVDELGTVYRAANWRPTAKTKGRPHDTGNRALRYLPGIFEHSTEVIDRVRWEYGPDAESEADELRHLGRRAPTERVATTPRGSERRDVMAGRFDYVKYDAEATEAQQQAKAAFMAVEGLIESQLKTGRAKALALTALEESYMWVGKQIRDDQIARGGDGVDQPQRTAA